MQAGKNLMQNKRNERMRVSFFAWEAQRALPRGKIHTFISRWLESSHDKVVLICNVGRNREFKADVTR